MKKILLLLLLPTFAHCQDYKSQYEADSSFTVFEDSTGRAYVNIEPYKVNLNLTYTRIYFSSFEDYYKQQYQIVNSRDSTYSLGDHDTTVRLTPILALCYSSKASFNISDGTASGKEDITVNSINNTAYQATLIYKLKFLFWYFAEKYNLTIQ